MRLFKQWILSKIFKPNKEKISGVWIKLHGQEATSQFVHFSSNYYDDLIEEDERRGACVVGTAQMKFLQNIFKKT
jgi:hypothetical protein